MKEIKHIALIILLMLSTGIVHAQLNPLTMQYFNNRFLGNAAYAGIDSGLNLNLNYRKQWNNIPGSPEIQNLTVDYGFKKTGLGLNVNVDKAGLQKTTHVTGSYAYHLPLNGKDSHLSFGLSLGMMNQRVSESAISGDPNDPLVARYNQRETYIDGDFGFVYQKSGFSIEAALPNLNFLFKRSLVKSADIATFYSAASYRFNVDESLGGIELEPRIAYRGVKGFDQVFDLGANASLVNNQFMLMGMYHSNKSMSLGTSLLIKQQYLIGASYTSQTSQLRNYANGSFEVNLKLKL
ncbi:PorP/SprF family type IX secretion system membrane protein [Pedobacter insulae]|uniref:Type IX secretion system membrane protein, PorP/SprF family n=1 Tax=Pedobacter insulae TaxID=414048 RepID=A0A1I2ZGY1_9SPHI|nr:PorP/SprF family type IX secretion system membrane protein [Pedobacter insulae]SFH36925.1 type IX secretion system membrane protein, PorP/SprF family [Pedobacter insulae]